LRGQATAPVEASAQDTSRLLLSYRAPYDWDALLAFLQARCLAGVEAVHEGRYLRTVRLGGHSGWIAVSHEPRRRALRVEFTHSLSAVLPALLGRLRHLFDLSARPELIAAQLRRDPALKADVARSPGLRVPGAFDGFELAVRAILGQQVTVSAATRLAAKLVHELGEPASTPFPDLSRHAPSPGSLVAAGAGSIAGLGIVAGRARALVALALAVEAGTLRLEPGVPPEATIGALRALPGIGDWTAQYIAMRALRWPDAFPTGDVALLDRLGGIPAAEAQARSQRWRPWRSYAVLHLWRRPARRRKDLM
jgi:AraC family transcriptional regulator of adaptative response / DNA-3-methyladenine glycosylase II